MHSFECFVEWEPLARHCHYHNHTFTFTRIAIFILKLIVFICVFADFPTIEIAIPFDHRLIHHNRQLHYELHLRKARFCCPEFGAAKANYETQMIPINGGLCLWRKWNSKEKFSGEKSVKVNLGNSGNLWKLCNCEIAGIGVFAVVNNMRFGYCATARQ